MAWRVGVRVELLRWWTLPLEEQRGHLVEAPTRGNPMATVRLDSGEVVTLHRGNLRRVASEP